MILTFYNSRMKSLTDSGYGGGPSRSHPMEGGGGDADHTAHRTPPRAFSNQTYMEHTEIRSTDSSEQPPSMSSRDPYSSRDSGIPGSLERPR